MIRVIDIVFFICKANKDQSDDDDSPTRPSPRAKRFEHAFLLCLCLWLLSSSIVGHHVHWATLISSLWHAERRRSHPKTRWLRRRKQRPADTAQGAPQERYVDSPMQTNSIKELQAKEVSHCIHVSSCPIITDRHRQRRTKQTLMTPRLIQASYPQHSAT